MNESEDIQRIQQELESIPIRDKAMIKGKVLVSRPLENRWCVNFYPHGHWTDLLGAIKLIRDACPG